MLIANQILKQVQQGKVLCFLLFSILFVPACEKVIDIDLNEVSPALVIEADISCPEGTLTVVISRTGSYFNQESLQKIDDATVYLENASGIQQQVVSMGNGIYKLTRILIAPGDKFKLTAQVEGKQFLAETIVNPPVNIDSISYSYYEGDSFFRPGYRFNLSLSDPAGEKNYYRIRVYKNNYLFNRPNDLVVFDDADHDGQIITVNLHSQYYVEKGETAMFELLSIDRQAWEYFNTFSDLINDGPGSPAPANPPSCFTNGALGYFYAWTYNRKSVVIE